MLVSSSVYAGKSCSHLEAELFRTSSELAPIMAVQHRTARHDVEGVFWLGLPVGMMDNTDIKAGEAKIGELKGNMDAINAARRKGGCVAGTRPYSVLRMEVDGMSTTATRRTPRLCGERGTIGIPICSKYLEGRNGCVYRTCAAVPCSNQDTQKASRTFGMMRTLDF